MKKYFLYIVLTRTNTVISKAIQWVKKDEYTHAAIALDEELNYMYSFGRKYSYFPFIGRFKQENFNTGLYKFNKGLPVMIMELEVSGQQYEDAKRLLDQFIANSRLYKYNYKGLLHCLFNKSASCDHRFLCSEFVYYILKESGVIDLEIPGNLVRPQSLLKLESRIVYKGTIRNLHYQKRHAPYGLEDDYDNTG
ncbi:hypothetical protein [Syntrophomonas curvata]